MGSNNEWAYVFTFMCRALGHESRIVVDWTDSYVWTECFIYKTQIWTHLDICEGFFDNPFMYEVDKGKKLNYIIAVSHEDCVDVTKRYT